MTHKNTRRGFTQVIVGDNTLFTSPLEGEDVRRTEEGAWNKSFMAPPLPAFGHPLPQGARITTRGFTLIELLVVVLIIGILAAVALPQYQKAVYKSRYIQLQVLVDSMAKAQEEAYLATGAYTIDPDELSVSMPQPKSIDDTKTGVKTLQYAWGYCNFATFAVSCNRDDIDLYYQHNYVHTNYEHAGMRECGVLDSANSYAMNICKQVTGKATPDWQSNSYASFFY